METRKIESFSRSSVQYLLYRICLKKELLILEIMFIYKNNYPCCFIKQILTQVDKQQERSNMDKNYNNGNSYTNTENNFIGENNSETSEKELSFITNASKVKTLFNT